MHTVEECRVQRQKWHPDKEGGDTEQFIFWQGEYQKAKRAGWTDAKKAEAGTRSRESARGYDGWYDEVDDGFLWLRSRKGNWYTTHNGIFWCCFLKANGAWGIGLRRADRAEFEAYAPRVYRTGQNAKDAAERNAPRYEKKWGLT